MSILPPVSTYVLVGVCVCVCVRVCVCVCVCVRVCVMRVCHAPRYLYVPVSVLC